MQNSKPGDTMYWWVYMSALLSFCLAWGPVMITYPFTFMEDVDAKFSYLIAAMASIDGPMIGNAFPVLLACWCYYSGYTLTTGWFIRSDAVSQALWWLSFFGYVLWTGGSIAFEIVFIPNIRQWFILEKSRINQEEEKKEIAQQFNSTAFEDAEWVPDYSPQETEAPPKGAFSDGDPNF